MTQPAAAGDLHNRVRFDKKVETPDPAGGSTFTWTEQFTRWTAIRPLMGGEGVQAQRLQGSQPVLLIVRRDSQTKLIDSTWRAVQMEGDVPGAFFALKTAQDMEMDNAFVSMMAVAGAADS